MLQRFIITVFFVGFMCSSSTAMALDVKLPGQAHGFEAHRAIYAVDLQSSRSASRIVNISGHMYYEWVYDCDAWNSQYRFNVLYEYADAPAVRITSDFSNFEAYDGDNLDFSVVRKQNGRQYQEIRGHAHNNDGQNAEAIYNQPAGLVQTLPQGTLFPMAHTLKIIDAIKKEEKFFNATIFDGSDGEGPVEINAFLGKPVQTDVILDQIKGNSALDQNLLKSPAYNLQLAFFPLNKNEQQADYEMDLTLHHNSVISDMLIHYGDFSVHQKLIAIEPIDTEQTLQSCQ